MEKEKSRESNFELLRIICMFMIVIMHYMGMGGALANTTPPEVNFYISHIIESLSVVSVNCFIMISGYFLIKSDFKLKRIVVLWLEVLFYSVGIYLAVVFTGLEKFSLRKLLALSFPVLLRDYWFISGYIALLVLSPFLNIGIKAFKKSQLEKIILILFFLFIVWGNTVPQRFLFVNNGYSLTHFVFLYTVAAYIRLYWTAKSNKYFYLAGYLVCAFLIGITGILLFRAGKIEWWYTNVLDYSFFFVFSGSLYLFMFMREVRIKSVFINRIASLMLGVYLIHEHSSIKAILYKVILLTRNYYHSEWFALHAFISVLFVFIISAGIDAVRKSLFNKAALLIKRTCNLISRQVGKEL